MALLSLSIRRAPDSGSVGLLTACIASSRCRLNALPADTTNSVALGTFEREFNLVCVYSCHRRRLVCAAVSSPTKAAAGTGGFSVGAAAPPAASASASTADMKAEKKGAF